MFQPENFNKRSQDLKRHGMMLVSFIGELHRHG
jgi:hypothetical protein